MILSKKEKIWSARHFKLVVDSFEKKGKIKNIISFTVFRSGMAIWGSCSISIQYSKRNGSKRAQSYSIFYRCVGTWS